MVPINVLFYSSVSSFERMGMTWQIIVFTKHNIVEYFLYYYIKHYFLCRPSESNVLEIGVRWDCTQNSCHYGIGCQTL